MAVQDHELIASRAYEIFLDRQREGVPGDELSDWYAAVEQLDGERAVLPAPRRGKKAQAHSAMSTY